MNWLLRIVQGLLAIGFLFFGYMKLSANPMMVESFNNIYGYGTGFMYIVGAIEVLSAIGLLVGYWKKHLLPIFSGILILVMLGAVFTHIKAGQSFSVAMTPFILLILSAFVFFSYKKFIYSKTV